MSERPKVAIVGAGSASFGPSVVAGLLAHPALQDLELALHDVDEAAAARMGRFAERLVGARGGGQRVSFGSDLDPALDGARVVIVSVAVDREATWARDRALAQDFGIEHYAENGGPGALFHTARNLALVLPVAWRMERRCPDAWMLNYTNPVPRVCRAVARYSRVKVAGVCHQLGFGYFVAGCLLAEELGLHLPGDVRFRWTDESVRAHSEIAEEAEKRLHLRAAGLNHFTWALSVVERGTGRDLYPALRAANERFDPGFEPLTRQVFSLFEHFPVPGDCHLAEYLPYTHEAARGTWARYDVQMYDFEWAGRRRREQAALVEAVARGERSPVGSDFPSERAEGLVAGLLGRELYVDEALNLPNEGAIANLPEGAIVETPATVLASGPQAHACGPLPPAVASLCARQITITDLSVRGIVEGDRAPLRQALALDPMVTDPALVDPLLARYLKSWDLRPLHP